MGHADATARRFLATRRTRGSCCTRGSYCTRGSDRMTPAEQKALGRAAVVLLVAGAVRWGVEWHRGPPVEVPGREDVLPELLEEARALRDEEERRSRPLEPGETLDLNRAPEVELDRLPGVGPATALAMVEARERAGGFQRVEDLLEVRGIGPATLEKLRPHVEVGSGRTTRPVTGPTARGATTRTPIDLNTATEAQLTRLSGIGPALAGRIAAERERRGGFRSVEELVEVRGIGPATLERIRPLVRVR